MSRFSPLEFQNAAIEKLTASFLRLWGKGVPQRILVFKSPTGSGKTLMVSNFINSLNNLPNWDKDKAIIWITFSDTLAMQSKEKFKEYFSTNIENNLLTIDDFSQGKLYKNDILFINWQKLVSRSAENRVLRRPDNEELLKEEGFYFEDIIENTKIDGREIILIVDESHTHLSELAQKTVIDVINPRIILNVSATPRFIPNRDDEDEGRAGYVRVLREDVIAAGLIKEKIVVQTDEDLRKFENRDLDELLIDLAIEKKREIEKEYNRLNKKINPLVLIQLPNDDNSLKDEGQKTKEEIVLDYLIKRGVIIDKTVALWFDGKQKNMEFITNNESDIDFMLFKQAAGTGWDCPRAHILIMYREINSATFFTQTIGRILRMPEPNNKKDYNESSVLKSGFLYTNYRRNEVSVPDQSGNNKPFIYIGKRVSNVSNVSNLNSEYVSRADYGDLGNAIKFQMSFLASFDRYFGIDENELVAGTREKITAKGVDLNPKLTNKLIVDAEFSDYDQLDLDFAMKGKDQEYEVSRNDVEKLFTLCCFNLLAEQTDVETRVSNISRSWSPFKSALRIWLKRSIGLDSNNFYKVFINDINKEQSSVFRKVTTNALKDYFPIRTEYAESRKIEIAKREAVPFEIKEEYNFTEDFEILNPNEASSKLSIIQPFYLRKEYNGRSNELKFIKYLEQQEKSLEWWFKNGEGSREFFCLKYYNTAKKEESLFFPDWIIKFKDGRTGLFDTKHGFTATATEGRAEGLASKIAELNKIIPSYVGGIVVEENKQWYYNASKAYEYVPGKLGPEWQLLETLFTK